MTMHDTLVNYFQGEKNAGIVLAVVGLVALGWAFYARSDVDLRGMFGPMALIGFLQLAIGVGLAAKTPSQVGALEAQLASAPSAFYAAERPRMERVQRNFLVIEVVEVALLAAGIALTLVMKSRLAWWGVGMGLVLQASVMLVFDLMAERRGEVYFAALNAAPPANVTDAPRP
jgi:hypothetical protein